MKQKFNAGAELDLITKDEVKELLNSSRTSWFNEVAKGDRYKRFSAQGTVTAGGTLAIGAVVNQRIGPNDGFVWSLKRLNVFATTAFDPSSDTGLLYLNDPSPSSLVRALSSTYTQFGNNEVVMYPGDTLYVAFTGLTATEIVTISGAVRELPLPMAWRLD